MVTAIARGYDFFTYYFTILMTPMLFLSGVFFPLSQLPRPLQWAGYILPLSHAVSLVRPLMLGEVPPNLVLHAAVLLAYTAACFYVAVVLLRRRLLA